MTSSSDSSLTEFMAELDEFKSTQKISIVPPSSDPSKSSEPFKPSEPSEPSEPFRRLESKGGSTESRQQHWMDQLAIVMTQSQRDYYQEQLKAKDDLIQRLVQAGQSSRFELSVSQKKIRVTGMNIRGWIWSKSVHTKVKPDLPHVNMDRSVILEQPYTGTLQILMSRRRSHLKLTLLADQINHCHQSSTQSSS